ncbi:succinate dehydrogenase, hydrophobic membrane anchor protein [Pseudoroseicyclus aestuarii]|uniref:Succinate dehydrogenase hydrophobic membrane anchor subunit n=1 Tax=Pseudoroseicyclus aestuarii TaxID=1795041 RepID=A0A318T8Q5_9RHOB|nr:succinate dehydrogenase, hydrophobic membrane anchor protein [Pseudoroseicyclus aestuarii]PYE84758.1 succinate dehydrogenase subunit D [Pseudoroseicyclus aestuarii]
MHFITDRKRATGLGASGSGTTRHWRLTVTSVALVALVVFFVFSFGFALGMPYEEAAAFYGRPFPAIVALLTFVVGMYHFRLGSQVMIEDYAGGATRHWLVIGAICLAYLLLAIGAFSVIALAVRPLIVPAAPLVLPA